MQTQYWVIGGEYDGTDFGRLLEGTSEVLGPFGHYHEATIAWRERALATRCKALMRYIIVSNVNWGTAAAAVPTAA